MELLFVNPEGRILRYDSSLPNGFEEFSNGRWGPLVKNISLGDPFDDDSRPLTPEELAMVEKSGAPT